MKITTDKATYVQKKCSSYLASIEEDIPLSIFGKIYQDTVNVIADSN